MLNKSYIVLFILCLTSNFLYADDLNDGIVADEAINDNLDLTKNMTFIQRNATAKSLRGSKNVITECGAGNQVFGPGANLKGATIVNLSNNKNTTSVCNAKK